MMVPVTERETLAPIPDRVEAGVRLLDQVIPGWWRRIDLEWLDLNSGCDCVLGQLFSHAAGCDEPYVTGLAALDLDAGYSEIDDAARCGFHVTVDVAPDIDLADDEYDRLTAAWANRIEARRAASGVPA